MLCVCIYIYIAFFFRPQRMFRIAVMCILAHGTIAVTESEWGSAVRPSTEHATMTFSGEFWWCDCWNTTEEEAVVECRCKGTGLLDVPDNLYASVQAL
jgi:hypothetical protein